MAFTLEVDEPPEVAQVGWGSPADFGSSIGTEGCSGDGWLVFAGGFLVDVPRCPEVTVRARGQEQTVEVGVGGSCGGQQPPFQQSDL